MDLMQQNKNRKIFIFGRVAKQGVNNTIYVAKNNHSELKELFNEAKTKEKKLYLKNHFYDLDKAFNFSLNFILHGLLVLIVPMLDLMLLLDTQYLCAQTGLFLFQKQRRYLARDLPCL